MTERKRTTLLSVLGVSAAILVGSMIPQAQADQVKLRLAHTAARSHAHHLAAEQFAKNVQERTKGSVTIEVYSAGELGDQPSLAEQVSLGSIDLGIISLGNLATYVPKLGAMTAPFLFADYDHAHKVIDGFVLEWINQDLGKMDAKALSMFDYGFRHTTTKGIAVNKADDLKGVKIRVPPSPGLLAAFDSVGANTQSIAYSELYSSLKQGVVDGQENPVFTILADSLFECQDQLALTGHYFDVQALIVNQSAWNDLSPENQKILQEEAIKAQTLTREMIQGGEADVIGKLKEKGMNVTTPDKASFISKMAPAYEKIGKLAGQQEMDKLLQAVKDVK